jgi:hypothetical protein
MASGATQPSKCQLRSDKIGILVIHGMGEQNPYETLDAFARGIISFLKNGKPEKDTPEKGKPEEDETDPALSPLLTALKDWTQVGMRVTVKHAEGTHLESHIDLFEYYWAPETEDKLSWKDTLKWLVRTDLSPLRYFVDNLQAMMATTGRGFWSVVREQSFWSALLQSCKLYAREIARVLFLYVPLAAALLWLLAWLAGAPAVWDSLKSIGSELRSCSLPAKVVLSCYGFCILMLWLVVQSIAAYFWRGRTSIEGLADRVWLGLTFLSATLLLLAGLFLSSRYNIDLHPLWAKILTKSFLETLCAALIALAFNYFLTAYVADVAVYVTSDAKSKNYAARTAILKGSCEALKRILMNDCYDYVILAGHSLGSVIAYDTINELLTQVKSDLGPVDDRPSPKLEKEQLQKLKGLVTFGSPLDKVYYFFREHVKEDQAIRAQILSMLYSFRKIESKRDYRPFEFSSRYKFKELDELIWLNAYAVMDFVSAKLKFYKLEDQDQRAFWYWVPGLAHLSYWRDPEFYSFLGEKLLCKDLRSQK